MIIIMRPAASEAEVAEVVRQVEATGFRPFINPGVERKVIAVLGEVDIDKMPLVDRFATLDGVERVQLISEPYKLASRHTHPAPLRVTLGLHPDAEPRTAYVTEQLGGSDGPVVAVSDYMKAVPDQVGRFVPPPFIPLGTDGYGRSDTRAALRRHFEVDAESIAVAVLHGLVAQDRGNSSYQVLYRALSRSTTTASSRS